MGFKKIIKQQILGTMKQSQAERSQELAALSDAQLRLYIPDVYQKDIYQIDYQRLWNQGIRLISFDIDDTIQDSGIDKIEGYLGVLDGIICPAHLSALAQHPFLTSSLEVLLPHVGSPPLWEHSTPVSQKHPPKTKSAYFWGIGACAFGNTALLKAPDCKGFKPVAISPKTHSGNITMS